MAQLLKLNGASRVVIAANRGIKMDIAMELEAGDEYIPLDRQNSASQWVKLKEDNPYGFDVVSCLSFLTRYNPGSKMTRSRWKQQVRSQSRTTQLTMCVEAAP